MSTPDKTPATTRKAGSPDTNGSPGKTDSTRKTNSTNKTGRTGKTGKRGPKDARLASSEELNTFLALLAESGNVSHAASEAKLDRLSLFTLREEDADFAAQWERARQIGFDALEDEARSRALAGWEEEVWYKGEQCGISRKYSATLLGHILKKDKNGDPGETGGAKHPPAPMNPADVMAELLRMQQEGG